MEYIVAFRVNYTVKLPWHVETKKKYFNTVAEAQAFLDPLVAAGRQTGTHNLNMPYMEQIGVLKTSDGRVYDLGTNIAGQ